MYHRNKVHTDDFWRYELTKNAPKRPVAATTTAGSGTAIGRKCRTFLHVFKSNKWGRVEGIQFMISYESVNV